MILNLDLKRRVLEDDEGNFEFTFQEWSYNSPVKKQLYGTYTLGNLTINGEVLSDVVYEPKKEVLSFEADYDGEDTLFYVNILSETIYSKKGLTKALDGFLSDYIHENPLSGSEGKVEGEVVIYFNYEEEDYNIKLNKLVLKEDKD